MSIRSLEYSVVALCILIGWSVDSIAAPTIEGVSGDFVQGNQLYITGSAFGQKSPAKPYLWAPFDGSAAPSSLGVVTSWDTVGHMAYAAGEGVSGSGALKATDSSGDWTAGIVSSGFAWNGYNQQMYLFRKVKRNFNITSDLNWKAFRVWGENYTFPDWYIQIGNGNLSVEGVGSGGYPYTNLAAARGTANTWRTDEILTQSNSSGSSADAQFYQYVNGVLVAKMPYTDYAYHSLTLKNSSSNDMRLIFPIHGVKANTTLPSTYRYWVDDVYLDTTWARVMVGNAPRLSDATVVEVQIPFQWSSTYISVTVNAQSFPKNTTAYLFVVDAQGNTSVGYPLSGSTLPPPSMPTGINAKQVN